MNRQPLVSLRNAKKFSRRVSSEELNQKVTDVLNKKGVNHKIQAKIVKAMCQVALESKNPHFAITLPNVRQHDTDPWNISFHIVKQFLAKYKLGETLDTLSLECKDKLQENKRFLGNKDVSVFLGETISQQKSANQSLQEKIDETFDEHPLSLDGDDSFVPQSSNVSTTFKQSPKTASPFKKPAQNVSEPPISDDTDTFVTLQVKTPPNQLNFDDFDNSQSNSNNYPIPLIPMSSKLVILMMKKKQNHQQHQNYLLFKKK